MIVTNVDELKNKCRETTIDECRELDIFNKLDSELAANPGVGLAANQIGLAVCACTIRPRPDIVYNMVNPKLGDSHFPTINQNEGCLSLPGVRLDTNRFTQVTCSWLDFDSGEERKGVFYGPEAIIVQHEVDHTNGILIYDRVAKPVVKVGRNDPCPECLRKGVQIKYKRCKEHYQ